MKSKGYSFEILSEASLADQYRRVYSKDRIVVNHDQVRLIPNSGNKR